MTPGRERMFKYPEQALAFVNQRISRREGVGRKVLFRVHLNYYTGYGVLLSQIIRGFRDDGLEVMLSPYLVDEAYGKIPEDLKAMITDKAEHRWELRFHPPNCLFNPERPFVLFTMWESTKLNPDWVAQLNRALAVVVPSVWNADNFSAAGVTAPIYVVPLGVNSEQYSYEPMDMGGPCVFGVGGRMAHGGVRKGINASIEVFQEAFPDEKDVRLKVKGYPDCPIKRVNDSRIHVTKAHLSESELHDWYASLTAYLAAAKSGGWELMPHEALSVGRPIIGTRYGGITEFFSESVGYPVAFKLGPAQGIYEGLGLWAEPNKKDLIKQMRRVYSDRLEARRKGLFGKQTARKFSWENTSTKLAGVLVELGLIEKF